MRRPLRSAPFLLAAVACGGSGGTNPMPSPTPTFCSNVTGSVTAGPLSVLRPTKEPAACRHRVDPATAISRCETATPDLSCAGQAAPRGTPVNVTFRGCVASFGLGATSFGLTVTVLRERTAAGQEVDPGYDVSGAAGAQAETTPSAVLGKAISTQVPRAQCSDEGYFEIPNVPTETDLIARVTHQNLEKGVRDRVDVYQYNIVLRNADVKDANGAPVTDLSTCARTPCFADRQVNTVQRGTYNTIALSAGVSSVRGDNDLFDGDGQGHIAGEIRDCNTSTQTSLQNAAVAIDATTRKLTYFNVGQPGEGGELDDPRPSATRTVTNADGLYLALAVDTMRGGRAVTVGAAITPSVCGADGVCQCTAEGTKNPAWTAADPGEAETKVLATRRVFVFPDSVTILTFDRELYTTR